MAKVRENQPALDRLRERLGEAAATLPDVHWRTMFGAQGLFSDHGIFALVFREGRIGLKLPEQAAFDELLAIEGADTWTVPYEKNPTKHWVLVPTSFHDDAEVLEKWVRKAYELSLTRPVGRKRTRSGLFIEAKHIPQRHDLAITMGIEVRRQGVCHTPLRHGLVMTISRNVGGLLCFDDCCSIDIGQHFSPDPRWRLSFSRYLLASTQKWVGISRPNNRASLLK